MAWPISHIRTDRFRVEILLDFVFPVPDSLVTVRIDLHPTVSSTGAILAPGFAPSMARSLLAFDRAPSARSLLSLGRLQRYIPLSSRATDATFPASRSH